MPVHIVQPNAIQTVSRDELLESLQLRLNERFIRRTDAQKPCLARRGLTTGINRPCVGVFFYTLLLFADATRQPAIAVERRELGKHFRTFVSSPTNQRLINGA